jgi:hypothetical protein
MSGVASCTDRYNATEAVMPSTVGVSDAAHHVKGFDPVAFFTDKKPVSGDPSITSKPGPISRISAVCNAGRPADHSWLSVGRAQRHTCAK